MALLIDEECINCDLCPTECPNEAISMGEEIFQIDSSKCTECVGHYDEPSCVAVCPVECITPDPKCKETVEQLAEKYTGLYG
ncbi:YfhL family 4Fe-4S dicluster ferredoxin [Glaciecola sp. KUL10]|uniref:YfhL family 4Fe-4S dicluster ferredoxin n=1 Tax=Glaciecola sp. (strain KUL10) TaxID=2161813 RepID=UPI000D78654F|nr:YfhL family 4Fe-4S dicluster ferredoxin [Glaciecola sp. KUL10]GBL03852.1 4Fe-4S ferredoxin iron-sulfur binding domain-containing protein [Glaciecola sp. KUL10]